MYQDTGITMRYARIGRCVTKMLFAVVLCVVQSSMLSAQSSLEVNVDRPSRILLENGYTTFTIDAINRSTEIVHLRVIRTLNERPDDTWEVSVCSPTICYDKAVDTLDPFAIGPGELSGAQVHILAGESGSARIVLSLDPQDGTDPVIVELRAEIGIPPQPSILATVDSTASDAFGGDTVEFGFYIFNATNDSLAITLKRKEAFFPDNAWSTWLCYFGSCVDPDVDSMPVTLASHQAALFAVGIRTGEELGTTGEVEIEVIPADGSEPTYHRFEATVTQVSGIRDNDNVQETEGSKFFPNPTTGSGTILLPERFAGKETVVNVVDGTGRIILKGVRTPQTVGLERSAILFDVGSLPSGAYRYRVQSAGDVLSGSFMIVR